MQNSFSGYASETTHEYIPFVVIPEGKQALLWRVPTLTTFKLSTRLMACEQKTAWSNRPNMFMVALSACLYNRSIFDVPHEALWLLKENTDGANTRTAWDIPNEDHLYE